MTTPSAKHTLVLTDKQVFVLQMALERFRDIDDSDFTRSTKIAEKLLDKLPETDLQFEDI